MKSEKERVRLTVKDIAKGIGRNTKSGKESIRKTLSRDKETFIYNVKKVKFSYGGGVYYGYDEDKNPQYYYIKNYSLNKKGNKKEQLKKSLKDEKLPKIAGVHSIHEMENALSKLMDKGYNQRQVRQIQKNNLGYSSSFSKLTWINKFRETKHPERIIKLMQEKLMLEGSKDTSRSKAINELNLAISKGKKALKKRKKKDQQK